MWRVELWRCGGCSYRIEKYLYFFIFIYKVVEAVVLEGGGVEGVVLEGGGAEVWRV